MNKARIKKKPGFFRKTFHLALLLLIATLFLMLFWPTFFFVSPLEMLNGRALPWAELQVVNIVLLGFDRTEARDQYYRLYRPDTIIIASINMRDAKASMVSIPRDSYVRVAESGIHDKINHSYMYGYNRVPEGEDQDAGGINSTLLTIKEFLGGVPIHGYIRMDMDGSAALIDAVGGIYVDIEEEFRSNYGRGSVQLEEGYQLLDGRKFLIYTRNRADYLGGERGRTVRQQQAMIALFEQLTGLKGFYKIPALLIALRANTESDLNLLQITALGLHGFRINASKIASYVFSGEGRLSYRDGRNIYYLVIDEEYRVNIIATVFGISVDKRSMPFLPGPIAPEPHPADEIELELEPELLPEPEPDQDPQPEPEPEPVEEDPDQPEEDEPDPEEDELPPLEEPEDLPGEEEPGV